MKNSSLLLILAVVAAIVIFFFISSVNNTSNPASTNPTSLSLQTTGSYVESYIGGTSGWIYIWSQPGATVTAIGPYGQFVTSSSDQGSLTLDRNGMGLWQFYKAGNYHFTITKSGYQSLTFNLDVPKGGGTTYYGNANIYLASTAPPSTPTLTIRTSPVGSDVRLTGNGYDNTVNSGTLGATFESLPSGTYTVIISYAGYQTLTATVPNTGTYSYSLVTVTSVNILTNPGAFVQLDQGGHWLTGTASSTGETPFESVLSGEHSVVISKAGYTSLYTDVQVIAGHNQFVLTLGAINQPKTIHVQTNYYSDITVDGIGTRTNTLEADFPNVADGQYRVTATSLCSGETKTQLISFPQTTWVNFEFPTCTPKVPPDQLSYALTVMSNPSDATATIQFYSGEQNTGTDGAVWQLRNGEYTVIVKKDGYNTKTEQVTIHNSNNLLVVVLEVSKDTVPPTVSITGPTSASRNELVTFIATGDREALYYNFDFGDGKTSGWTRTYVITHYYRETGEYTASVQVKTPKGLLGGTDTIHIAVLQEWKLFTPYITTSDVVVGKIATVKITLPTNLAIDNYYLQTYIRTAKGTYIIPRWTTLETNFTGGSIIATFQYWSNDTGKLTIGAQGIAMDPMNYKDTGEFSINVNAFATGTTSTETGTQTNTGTGTTGTFTQSNVIYQYLLSIAIIVIPCVIIICILVFLIIRERKRRHY